MVLFRRLLGDVLRRHRMLQGRTLRDVAASARVSLGYLSEVERGIKEASSELLAALCEALGLSLADVLREVSDDLVAVERRPLQSVGFLSGSRPAMRPVAGLAPRPAARTAERRMPATRAVDPARVAQLPPAPVAPATVAPVAMLAAGAMLADRAHPVVAA